MALGSFAPLCVGMMPYLPELVLEEHYGLGSLIADCRGHGAGWFGPRYGCMMHIYMSWTSRNIIALGSF